MTMTSLDDADAPAVLALASLDVPDAEAFDADAAERDDDHADAAPARDTRFGAGNRAWARRRSPGRRRRFADEHALWSACTDYFRWSDAHPLIRLEPVTYRGKLTMVLEVPKLRPYSIAGLCAHLRIGRSTWVRYRCRADFRSVCEHVENAIQAQQFEGAAAGLFDSRIVRHWLAAEHRAGRCA